MAKLIINYGTKETISVTATYLWPESKVIKYIPTQSKGMGVKGSRKGQNGQNSKE